MFFVEKTAKFGRPSRTDFAGKRKFRQRSSGFKGVRMRKWGKWVSEIRVPRSRERIWLGSYDSPEKAARAYDAALYCLRGPDNQFNFPAEKRPEISSDLTVSEIKAIAARCAAADSGGALPDFGMTGFSGCSCYSSTVSTQTSSPEFSVCGLLESVSDITSSIVAGADSGTISPGSFLLEDPILPELNSIWDF